MSDLYFDDLIGVPWKLNGRDARTGLDCYGLTIEIERRLGHKLRDIVFENHDEELVGELIPTLNVERTSSPELGVIVEIIVGGKVHSGVCLNSREFIHSTENRGVKVSRLSAYPINDFFIVKDN